MAEASSSSTTPASENVAKLDEKKGTGEMKKCFQAIVDRKAVKIHENALLLMATNELNINLKELDPLLVEVLPQMILLYIKTWPGWQRSGQYYSGQITYKEWFERFKQYMMYKTNYLIKEVFQPTMKSVHEEEKSKMEKLKPKSNVLKKNFSTQLNALGGQGERGFSPFQIAINGPPSLLNTLIFSNREDDVYIKIHMDKNWSELNLKQLLNWPFLEVEFISPELRFTRKFLPDYMRYLTHVNELMKWPVGDFIDHAEIVNREIPRKRYSVPLLVEYVTQYLGFLKVSKLSKRERTSEMVIILEEFLQDIKQIGPSCEDSIATNTEIGFNIGYSRYIRNKKMNVGSSTDGVSGSSASVGYCELMIPKVFLHIHYFKGAQIMPEKIDNSTNNVTFTFMNKMKKLSQEQNVLSSELIQSLPATVYACRYCNKEFAGTFALKSVTLHYKDEHKMEHPILCYDCKTQYQVSTLTSTRWYHNCKSRPAAIN